ncbi:MAG: class I SAM-dependent methyltransferase [Nitrospirota bacterium]
MLAVPDHDPEVFALIRAEITARGPITFARFMDLALYAPGAGYYMRDADQIGARGDFYTSSQVHVLFGEMIARQLDEMAVRIGAPRFTVVECGAGRGTMAHDILTALTASGRGPALHYMIVEKSPAMIARQRRLLDPFAAAGRVTWAAALPTEPIVGCVLSNELLDAFPVHRVARHGGRLQEIYVDAAGDGFVERMAPPSTPELAAYLDRVDVTLVEGQQAEVNLAAVAWMRAAGRALGRGFVLSIDYGYPAEELYAPHRVRGTLLAYHRHRTNEAFLNRVGRQDLTAHVDFTSLALAGREVGLDVEGFTNQTGFLLGLGAHEVAERLLDAAADEAARADTLAGVRGLLDPHGMGQTFKVLIQRKGVPPSRLRGLSLGSGGAHRLAAVPDG